MGKHGPCYHCGVTSTPLWRNGPPEKPVLCNACGSRWRTKGTLANYTPLHARADPDELEDPRFSKMKTISIKNKEPKVLKRKLANDAAEFGFVPPGNNQGFPKGFDEDTSNKSSSGSAVSNSESCAQYGSVDASDLTGPAQPSVWDSMVPSRKRTCVTRPKPSPVEKLTKDLYTLWHEQQSSCLSASSEEDLLLESDKPMVSVEIGHGSVLIRHPNSIAREEESEASSLSVENKQHYLNSWHMSLSGLVEDTGANSLNVGNEKMKKHEGNGPEEQHRRDKDQLVILPVLTRHNSPLCYIDLQEIVNLETFSSYFAKDERQQLMKLLPSVDTLDAPFSLKSMFDSSEFNMNLLSFQNLLADGVLDNSFRGADTEDCKILKRLILCDLAKSKWVEKYTTSKDLKCQNSIKPEMVGEYNGFETVYSANKKRSRDWPHQKIAESKFIMKSPRTTMMKYDQKELIDKNSFMSVNPPFSNENSSFALDSSHFDEASPDQDLLLDVPSNGSFPQAELLPSSSFGALASTSSSSFYPNLVPR